MTHRKIMCAACAMFLPVQARESARCVTIPPPWPEKLADFYDFPWISSDVEKYLIAGCPAIFFTVVQRQVFFSGADTC